MALHKLPKSYSSDFSNPDKKPVGITDINYKHPFNRRVRHIWGAYRGPSIVNDGYGFGVPLEFYYDIVSGIAPHTYLVSGNDAPEFRPNTYGTAAHYKNVGDSFRGSYIQEGGMFLADHDGTMLFCGELNSVTGTQFLIGQSNSGISPIYKYGCALAVVDGVLYAWRSSNNTNQKVSLPVGAGKVIAAVSFSGSSIKLSVNGVSVSGVCRGSGTAYDFGFGRDAHSNNEKNRSDMDGSINMAAISYHPLSEAELNALTLKPYDILKPKNDPVYFTSDAAGGSITVSPTLGTISYSGNATTIGLFGSIDVTSTLGTISYTGNNTTVGLFGVVDVAAGLGTISYTSNNATIQVSGAIEVNPTLGAISYTSNATTVQVSGSVDVTATLGAISYTSNNTVVDLGGAITVAAGLGTINYVSNDTIVGLAGQIGINATLGTISYTSNNTIVIASNGQSIGEVNTSFAGDLYGSNFKPNSITVTFRG